MGMWKVSSLDAKRADDGKWVTLAGPAFGESGDFKKQLEQMTTDGGVVDGVQYELAIVRTFSPEYGKRRKFKVPEKATKKRAAKKDND